jgi:hypothetical protein
MTDRAPAERTKSVSPHASIHSGSGVLANSPTVDARRPTATNPLTIIFTAAPCFDLTTSELHRAALPSAPKEATIVPVEERNDSAPKRLRVNYLPCSRVWRANEKPAPRGTSVSLMDEDRRRRITSQAAVEFFLCDGDQGPIAEERPLRRTRSIDLERRAPRRVVLHPRPREAKLQKPSSQLRRCSSPRSQSSRLFRSLPVLSLVIRASVEP